MNKYKKVGRRQMCKRKNGDVKTSIHWLDKEFKEYLIKQYALKINAGLTCQEAEAELCAEHQLKDASTIRKAYQERKAKYDIIINTTTEQEYLNIAKARARLKEQQKINVKERNVLHNEANIVAYRQMVIDAVNNYKWKTYKLSKNILKQKKSDKSYVYIISDEHYRGSIDDKHLVNIFNTIKQDIKDSNIKKCELWFLGDGIDGLIHLGSLAQNDGAIIPTIKYCNICIELINQIPQINKVNYVSKSNHTQTRALGSKRNELAKEDLGLLIAEFFSKGLREDIEFNCNEIIHTEFNNKKVMLLHGHQMFAKSKNKILDYISSKKEEIPDMIYMGHWHQCKFNEFGNNKWLCVAPTAKNDESISDYDNDNAFYNIPQVVRLNWDNITPEFKVINVDKGE